MPNRVPEQVLSTTVEGLNLAGGTLAQQLTDPCTLLVFLRHFGCPFCREMVKDLRKITHDQQSYPPILFFFQHSVEEGRAFFSELWPQARAVADPTRGLYQAFELRRATMNQMFGLRVWTCAFRAMSKGNFIGLPVGDPWLMPGLFLVHDGRIVWSHAFTHQGDHPDWTKIPSYIPALHPL